MESLSGGGTPPEKPNKLIAWVNRLLRKGQNQLPEQPETLPDNPDELAERDRLAELITRKVLHDISTEGFTRTYDMGKEARGNPYGADVWVNTYAQIGYSNSLGKRYRADLDSSRIVGGPVKDELELIVYDRQDAQLKTPDQHKEHQLRVWRQKDKVAGTDDQKMSVTLYKFDREAAERDLLTKENGNFNIPISEQLQFLRELLDISVDRSFTEEMARVVEEEIGKVTWNRDNPSFSINLGSGFLLPPK